MTAALLLAGCKQVSGLFETELDDSAEGMSGRWEVVELRESADGCDALEAAQSPGDTVMVEVVAADGRATNGVDEKDDSTDAGGAQESDKRIDVTVCDGDQCQPVAGRYSRFERAEPGWSLDGFEANWSRHPACLARHKHATFVLLPEAKARLEVEYALGEWLMEGDEDCDDDVARDRRERLECHFRQSYELRRPADATG